MRSPRQSTVSLFAFAVMAVPALRATSFANSATGAVITSNCLTTVNLSIFGGGLSNLPDGLRYAGSFARITLSAGTIFSRATYGPCTVTYTSDRAMNDVSGTYTLGSEIDANVQVLGTALNATLALLGLNTGPTTLTLNTFLVGNPAHVATASLNLSTLNVLSPIHLSGRQQVHAAGTEILRQQIVFNFNSSGNSLVNLGAVINALSSPEFDSTIRLFAADPPDPNDPDDPNEPEDPPAGVPEPGTFSGGIGAVAMMAAVWRQRRYQPTASARG